MKPLFTVLAVTFASTAWAHPNVPANHCEIYPKSIRAIRSSHSMAGVDVDVRVPYLGSGETIQRVGFYGHVESEDLGNGPTCFSGPMDGATRIIDAYDASPGTGSYVFSFPTYSGTVVSECPGYTYAWRGTFFVETSSKTYWVNPGMDPSQLFTFDDTLQQNLEDSGNLFRDYGTNSAMLSFYNPRSCTR